MKPFSLGQPQFTFLEELHDAVRIIEIKNNIITDLLKSFIN